MSTGFTNTLGLEATIPVNHGGTGKSSFTAYAPVAGGVSTTSAFQSLSSGISTSGYVLTSTGASSVPTWQLPVGYGSFTSVVYKDNGAPGSYTYTPTSGMVYVLVEVIGGGGSGGRSGSANLAAGGGGAGGYARAIYTAAQIGASKTYTVGSGGAGSSGGNDGGNTYFISNGTTGTYLVGAGGKKGLNTSNSATTGLDIVFGGNGGVGSYGGTSTSFVSVTGGAGYYGIYIGSGLTTGSFRIGGQGGSSFYSNMYYVAQGSASLAGVLGGGGQGSASGGNGGNGGPGYILFTEFIA